MKITIKDFQILSGTKILEFPVGITTIIGSNASGKSSIFYSVLNTLLNPNGVADCINHHSKSTSVTIDNNDESVTWTRTPSSSFYKNNKTGQEYVKASNLDSWDIANLGFYRDKKGKVINIHDEWSVLFPFGESDADMFRLFEDIFNISCSFQIIDEIKKDEQLLKSNIANDTSSLNDLKAKQLVLNKMKDDINVDELNYHHSNICSKKDLLDNITNDFRKYKSLYVKRTLVLPKDYDDEDLCKKVILKNTIIDDFNSYKKWKKCASLDIKIDDYVLDVPDNRELTADYSVYLTTLKKLETINAKLNELETSEANLSEELSKIKVCPTCGRPIGDENGL